MLAQLDERPALQIDEELAEMALPGCVAWRVAPVCSPDGPDIDPRAAGSSTQRAVAP